MDAQTCNKEDSTDLTPMPWIPLKVMPQWVSAKLNLWQGLSGSELVQHVLLMLN